MLAMQKSVWPAAVITDARLLAGYEYWRGKAADRAMPRRTDIDPTEIPKLLPHVRLVDVVGPGRYRYRLVGTAAQALHGSNPTGRLVHEVLSGPIGKRIVAVYDECAVMGRAIYFEAEFLNLDGAGCHRRSKVMFTPLSEDGRKVSQVLVFQVASGAGQAVGKIVDAYIGAYSEIAHAVL